MIYNKTKIPNDEFSSKNIIQIEHPQIIPDKCKKLDKEFSQCLLNNNTINVCFEFQNKLKKCITENKN